METLTHNSPVLLEWSAQTMHDHVRSRRWYMIAGVVLFGMAAYGIVTGTWSMTVVMLLLAGVYMLVQKTPAPLTHMSLETTGFTFDGSFTLWSDCEGFWFITTPLAIELHILRKHGLKREFSIQTADIDPRIIRAVLKDLLTERSDQKEKLLDKIIRICQI